MGNPSSHVNCLFNPIVHRNLKAITKLCKWFQGNVNTEYLAAVSYAFSDWSITSNLVDKKKIGLVHG